MTRPILLLLAACSATASAQGLQQQTGPAQPPQTLSQPPQSSSAAQSMVLPDGQTANQVEVQADGRCPSVRPGDTVNFALTIEGIEGMRTVFADLLMRREHAPAVRSSDLPGRDYQSTGGGGRSVPDGQQPKMYHFSFKVQREIFGGVYHGHSVMVAADEAAINRARAAKVDVSRHTREQVKDFCLTVISSFGREIKPEVVNFQPGAIDPSPAAVTTGTPLPGSPR